LKSAPGSHFAVDGNADQQNVLQWNAGENRYQIVRRLPLVGLNFPRNSSAAAQNNPSATDIRLNQVTDLVDNSFADRDARQLHMPAISPAPTCVRRTQGPDHGPQARPLQTNNDRDNEGLPRLVIPPRTSAPTADPPRTRHSRVDSRDPIENFGTTRRRTFNQGWVPCVADPFWNPCRTTADRRFYLGLVADGSAQENAPRRVRLRATSPMRPLCGIAGRPQRIDPPRRRKTRNGALGRTAPRALLFGKSATCIRIRPECGLSSSRIPGECGYSPSHRGSKTNSIGASRKTERAARGAPV